MRFRINNQHFPLEIHFRLFYEEIVANIGIGNNRVQSSVKYFFPTYEDFDRLRQRDWKALRPILNRDFFHKLIPFYWLKSNIKTYGRIYFTFYKC
jgi:hypothetical protein